MLTFCLVASLVAVGDALQAPSNDVLLRCARGESVERVPVWLFRQAGRHMPEYNAFKEESGMQFLDILKDPKAVAEVTMQPLRRYDVDAGILFSDILVVAQAMGVKVEMPGGKGIVVPEPVRTAKRASYISEIASHDPEWLVRNNLRHVTQAVTEIRSAQLAEDRDVTLLGFSAAPWTLLYYVLGSNSRDKSAANYFFRENPELSQEMLDSFQSLILEYCYAQVEAGAHAVQIFDAMAGGLASKEYDEIVLPRLSSFADEFKKKYPDIPLLCFSRGVEDPLATNKLLSDNYDVVTLETKADAKSHRSALPQKCLQGNLDPKFLVEEGEEDSLATLLEETSKLKEHYKGGPWIANLGEGLMGKESPELVKAFVDAVHS